MGHPKILAHHGTGPSSPRRAAYRRVRACPTARLPHARQTRQLGRAARPSQHREWRRLGGGYIRTPTRSAEGGGGERCGLSPATLRTRGHRGGLALDPGPCAVPPLRLHPRAPSPPRPARAHRAPSVTRGSHAALRRSRARAPPLPRPPATLAATHFRPAPLRRGPAAPHVT